MRVSSDMPDDVLVLHDALARLRDYKKGEHSVSIKTPCLGSNPSEREYIFTMKLTAWAVSARRAKETVGLEA